MSTEQPTASTDPTPAQDDAEGHLLRAQVDGGADDADDSDDTAGHGKKS